MIGKTYFIKVSDNLDLKNNDASVYIIECNNGRTGLHPSRGGERKYKSGPKLLQYNNKDAQFIFVDPNDSISGRPPKGITIDRRGGDDYTIISASPGDFVQAQVDSPIIGGDPIAIGYMGIVKEIPFVFPYDYVYEIGDYYYPNPKATWIPTPCVQSLLKYVDGNLTFRIRPDENGADHIGANTYLSVYMNNNSGDTDSG